jgi:hypothetical protein
MSLNAIKNYFMPGGKLDFSKVAGAAGSCWAWLMVR